MANAKLDRASAAEIRERAEAGEGVSALAEEYGVAPSTVRAVLAGDTWCRSAEEENVVPSPTRGWGAMPLGERLERIHTEVQACIQQNQGGLT